MIQNVNIPIIYIMNINYITVTYRKIRVTSSKVKQKYHVLCVNLAILMLKVCVFM